MGKILFIRGGAVGDFILTLPAIGLVREQLPTAGIELLGYPPTNRLALASGLVDAAKSMEYGPLAAFFVPNGTLPEDLATYFAGFSVVVSYLYDPDGYFAENLRRAGVKTLLLGPHRVDEGLADQPAAAQLARPLESLALYLDRPWITLDLPEASVAEAGQALPDLFAGNHRWVALHPGSGSPRKNWSFEGWVDVAASLGERDPSIRFLVTHGEAEEPVIEAFLALLRDRGVPHVRSGHLSLPALGALLRRCDLYLGHDTGVSHLAAACAVPSVLLFGRTDLAIWAPRHPAVSVIAAPDGDLSQIRPGVVSDLAWSKLSGRATSSPP